MAGLFACPECLKVLAPRGTPAGRQIRCDACGTLVEIPLVSYTPGARHRNKGRVVGLSWAGIGLVAAVLMVVVAVELARKKGLSAREGEVSAAVARSEQEEKLGRFPEAVAEVESAIKIARALDPSARKPLKERRDRLALMEAEASLAASQVSPDPVAALRALRERVEADPARDPVRDQVNEALRIALARKADTDLAEASRALASGHPDIALGLCEGVAAMADELGFDRASTLRESARVIAEQVIEGSGVVISGVKGQILPGFGSAQNHSAKLNPLIAGALRRKGYFPKPSESAFLASWDKHAPFSVTLDLVERLDGTFFSTPSHTTRLNLHVTLSRGPTIVWESRPSGTSRVPPPDMAAFEMSRLTLGKARDPELEKRLYEDARILLAENLVKSLQGLPAANKLAK